MQQSLDPITLLHGLARTGDPRMDQQTEMLVNAIRNDLDALRQQITTLQEQVADLEAEQEKDEDG